MNPEYRSRYKGMCCFIVKCTLTDVWGHKTAIMQALKLGINTNNSVIILPRPGILFVRLVLLFWSKVNFPINK